MLKQSNSITEGDLLGWTLLRNYEPLVTKFLVKIWYLLFYAFIRRRFDAH